MARILALDPAFRNVGWTYWHDDEIKGCGVITTTPAKKDITRANAKEAEHIAEQLLCLLRGCKIEKVVAEIPMGSQNSRAANLGGAIMGIVASVCWVRGVPLVWVAPNDIKQVVARKELVSKDRIMEWVRENYPYCNYPKTKKEFEHIADSVLVYIFCEKGLDNT